MRRRLIVLGLILGAVTWAAIRAVEGWRYDAELRQADREIASGQPAKALPRLRELVRRWPGQGQPDYLLGVAEERTGRVDEALAAWGKVPSGSSLGLRAALRRARLAMDHARLTVAEESLDLLAHQSGAPSDEVEGLRLSLFWLSGRSEEAARLLREQSRRSGFRAEVLRKLWLFESEAFPVEGVREILDKAGREAPEDDRVWLGRADLATRSGRLDEANDWLKRCEARRPADPSVWRARLTWALAADRFDEVARASAHLTDEQIPGPQILQLRARIGAHRGDPGFERDALSELLKQQPGDAQALERLAELASSIGKQEEVAELRRRKAELDRVKERYRKILSGGDPTPQASELGRTAEALGRWFEAEGWWSLRARAAVDDPEPREALGRLAARSSSIAPPSGKILADLLPTQGPARPPDRAPVEVPSFTDDAEPSGLSFTHESGKTPLRQLPETMGGGVGLLDYDGDGWLDVYVVQGGTFPPPAGSPIGDRLFRNRGDGTFEDATDKAGLSRLPGGYGHGVASGDFDNDGHPDLFITRWRAYALYRNRGDGTFEDATDQVGLGGARDWPTSAAFADLDEDGDLDLYVCHYLDWDPGRSHPCRTSGSAENSYCDPREFAALPDHLYRNDGGRFVDVTAEAGIVDRDGRGLGVIAADLDGDRKVDLFVANDTTANYLFRNLGGLRFREEGMEAGVATNAAGGYLAGMGIALGDLDGDGLEDLAVTNFFGESTTYYHNWGRGQFSDHTAGVGLALPSRFLLGFGAAFLDANDDGWLDLATANGHVSDFRPAAPYAMPAQLLIGGPGGRLSDVSSRAGAPWSVPRIGRGLAVGDLDNDGSPDLVIVSEDSPLAYFHNKKIPGSHSLSLRLEGTISNRDGVGAVVKVTAGGRTRTAQRFGGGSYLSAGDQRLHFGVGPLKRVDRVEVSWPSGRSDPYSGLEADSAYRLREADPTPKTLPGPRRSDEGAGSP